MTRLTLRALPVALLAVALGACAGGQPVAVSNVYEPFNTRFATQDLGFAASRGPVPVYVRGSPFPTDPAGVSVVQALQRQTSLPNLQLVPSAAPGPGGFRAVMAFGGFVPGVNYCAGPPDFPIAGSPPGTTRIAATLCIGRQIYGSALVTGGPVTGPGDPTLDAMMGALVAELAL